MKFQKLYKRKEKNKLLFNCNNNDYIFLKHNYIGEYNKKRNFSLIFQYFN
jgi:hypothetical protein